MQRYKKTLKIVEGYQLRLQAHRDAVFRQTLASPTSGRSHPNQPKQA